MYSDWHLIPIPARLSLRPTDNRGYPIPALVLVDKNGTPDFRVTDIEKWMRAYKVRTCALCGQPLGKHLAFVGGDKSHESRFFTDLPMHRDCAEYALKVCPYLAAPNFKYSEALTGKAEYLVSEEVSTERPQRFMLGITNGCAAGRTEEGTLVVQAQPWSEVSWWKEGEIVG